MTDKRGAGRYYHVRIADTVEQHNTIRPRVGSKLHFRDFTESKESGSQWTVRFMNRVGSKADGTYREQPSISPYEREWEARAHSDKLNEEFNPKEQS